MWSRLNLCQSSCLGLTHAGIPGLRYPVQLPLGLSKTHFPYWYSGVSMRVSYKQSVIANMIARFIIY